MAGKLGALTIDIAADVASLRRDMSRAENTIGKSTQRIAKSAQNATRALGGIVSVFAGGALVRSVIQATRAQEDAVRQLEQGLATTGGIVGRSLEELTRKAAELQSVTTFGDEDIIAAQSQLVTFTNIAGEQFDKTIELALDLSTRLGTDLKSSVLQLGKALNDPVKNLSALSRAGIQFSESQIETVKSLVATGRQAEAQRLILRELEVQFGGSARAARDTFGGALDSLGNAFGDLLEADGGLTEGKDAIEGFTAVLQDPATVAAADSLTSAIVNITASLAAGAVEFANFSKFLGEFVAKANGASIDELDDQIAAIKDELEIREEGGFLDQLDRQVGFVGDSVDELRDKLRELQLARDLNVELSSSPVTAQVSQDTPSPVQAPPASLEADEFSESYARIREENDRLFQDILDNEARKIEGVRESLFTQEEAVLASYQRQRDIIISATSLTGEERIELLKRNEQEASEVLLQEVEVTAERVKNKLDEVSSEAEESGSFVDSLISPNDLTRLFSDFENIEDNFKRLIASMVAEAISANIAQSLLGGSGGGVGSFFGSLFGGARAMGGEVEAGKFYKVGERGQEYFAPTTDGVIIPNGGMGGGPVNVSINVNGGDADSFMRSSGQIAQRLARDLRSAGRNA